MRCLTFVFALLLVGAGTASAEIFKPGDSVPNIEPDVFTWAENAQDSTWAFWDSFAPVGGSVPGGIGPGQSADLDLAANSFFIGGSTRSALTFESFASVLSSGNAYGFNFAPNFPEEQQALFITDAFATVRPDTTGGGSNTRVVAQWQTQGSNLDDSSILLSLSADTEGTLAPDLLKETGRTALGGFGGDLVTRIAIWDLDSQSEYRVDFRATANHMSLDQFRVDTFTQNLPFDPPSAVPEPGSLLALSLVSGAVFLRRKRRC